MRTTTAILNILDSMVSDGSIEERIYATPSKTNVSLSRAKMPCAVVYCITDSTIDIDKRMDRETAQIFASFHLRQQNIAFDGEQNEQLIDQAKDIAMDFVTKLLDSDQLTIQGDTVHVRPFYNANDTNTTGVTIEVSVSETAGGCI